MQFQCPNCKKEIFKAESILKAINDFKGQPCPICSYRLKEKDTISGDIAFEVTSILLKDLADACKILHGTPHF